MTDEVKPDRMGGDGFAIQYGFYIIGVQTCDSVISSQFEDVHQRHSSWLLAHNQPFDCRLMVVSPYYDDIANPKYQAISRVWASARGALKSPNPIGLDAWRTLHNFGTLVDQSIFLFHDKDGSAGDFFCLNPTDTVKSPWSPSSWIVKAIEALGVHWYVTHGGALFHASGLERKGSGYLFLGQSGAGKSTVASLSELVRAKIVHDDQIMLAPISGQYLLAHPSSRITPPLRGIFLLKQSKEDRLVPLTPQATGAGLSKSLLEYAIGQDLYGPWVRQAFQNAAAIARTVPGYELHFRKSPDFWKLIDEQLPN